MQKWGFLGVTFVCKRSKILLLSEFLEKKLNSEGLQTYAIKSSDHFLGQFATITSILMNQH